jgi:integrase
VKLTERKIEKLVTERGRKDRLVFDDAQRGLAVRVTASGGRTYLCQYTLHGHKARVPLGACSAVSLAMAREAAASVMGDVAKGRNPAQERKDAAAAERARRARGRLTLGVLIEDWQRLHLVSKRPSYAAEAVRALHHALGDHLNEAAEDLNRAAVVRALDALTRRRKPTKPQDAGAAPKARGLAMTGRTAAYGRAAYAWAIRRGTVIENPFEKLAVHKRSAARDRVLSHQEIIEVWHAAEGAGVPYGATLRLLLLTGQRRGEIAGMTWDELSSDLTTWTLPGRRTKNGEEHIVPISAPARRLLKGLLPDDNSGKAKRILNGPGALVLPGGVGTPFSGWSKAKKALDRAVMDARKQAAAATGETPTQLKPWSVHDLRRTVATGLQRLGVRLEVTEAILNHISGSRSGIAGVYQRHDWAEEKRVALDAWAAHVVSLVAAQPTGGNVLRLKRKAR